MGTSTRSHAHDEFGALALCLPAAFSAHTQKYIGTDLRVFDRRVRQIRRRPSAVIELDVLTRRTAVPPWYRMACTVALPLSSRR